MRADERIVVNEALIAAYQAASSSLSIRALKSDLEAFDRWCRHHNRIALPTTPETVADYLDARAEKGSKPASLGRYKASIAKVHLLLDLKDPTPASLVKLRLQAIRRRLGTAQTQARPLRFKGPVRNVERDAPRGLNVGARHPSSVEAIYRAMIQRAFDAGALADLTADDLARLLKGISAHSTRVGLNQDLFKSGEDLAGIMDALRWKSPRIPLAYNRNFAAEQGAAGRLLAKLG